MDYSTFGSVTTVVMLVVFLAIVAWACSSRRNAQFEAAARVPFEEDIEPAQRASAGTHGEKS
jgi:cytochrome c oxidase cbb3-type subunit 4